MYFSPKRVRTGSKVAIVAPSATFATDELSASMDVIRECGLEPIVGPCVKNLRTAPVQRAASVQERVEELHWAFSDTNISAVIAVRGGEGSAALLPYLNYELIQKSQKVFLGKSDNTSISMALLKKSKLSSINGRGANIRRGRGKETSENDCESLKWTLQLLMSDQPWRERSFKLNQHFPRTVSPGVSSGYAIGGNCDTFTRLIGTNYLPSVENAILFIEDVDKDEQELSRMFLHLKLSGVLNSVAGIVIGEFVNTGKRARDFAYENVIEEYFSQGPPCIYGLSFSHGDYTCPIPLGSKVNLNASEGVVEFDFQMKSAVR